MNKILLADKYEIIGEIARGGMGVISLAAHTTLGRQVAVKTLHPQYCEDPAFIKRFLREARAMARLDHENIVRIFDVVEHGHEYHIIMEYFPGESIKEKLLQTQSLSIPAALSIAHQVAQGLAYAHKLNIVHRDIKPANLLIDNTGKVKITDFGIAAAADEADLTITGQVVGTPHYMAPEQARSDPVDHRSDIYSLGIVLLQMLTGKTPLEGRSLVSIIGSLAYENDEFNLQLPNDIPADLKKIITTLVRKNPQERHYDATTLAIELAKVPSAVLPGPKVSPLPIPTPIPSSIAEDEEPIEIPSLNDELDKSLQLTRTKRKKNLPLFSGLVFTLLLSAGAGYYFLTTLPPTPSPSITQIPTTAPTIIHKQADNRLQQNQQQALNNPPPNFDELAKLKSNLTKTKASIAKKTAKIHRAIKSAQQANAPKQAPKPYDSAISTFETAQASFAQGEAKENTTDLEAALVIYHQVLPQLNRALNELTAVTQRSIQTYRQSIDGLQAKAIKVKKQLTLAVQAANQTNAAQLTPRRYSQAQQQQVEGLSLLEAATHYILASQYQPAIQVLQQALPRLNTATLLFLIAENEATKATALVAIKALKKQIKTLESPLTTARRAAENIDVKRRSTVLFQQAQANEATAIKRQQLADKQFIQDSYTSATKNFTEALSYRQQALDDYQQVQRIAQQQPQPPEQPDIDIVGEKLRVFKLAYEARDLEQLKKITQMSPQRAAFLGQLFTQYQTLDISIAGFTLTGESALAVVAIDRLVTVTGDVAIPAQSWQQVQISLRKNAGQWSKIDW